MSNITIDLQPETKEILAEKAVRRGRSLESYARALLEADAQNTNGSIIPPRIESAEFDRLLALLSAGLPPLPVLPAEFSRADIYDEHD